MIFTALLMPFYVLAALLSNSAAIFTDLLSTLLDLVALTSCWLVLRLAHSANSGRYAYGLGKLENLTELMIAILQALMVFVAGSQAVSRIIHPEPVEGAFVGLLVTAMAVAGNVYLNRKARRLAQETRSPVLAAQARVHFISAIGSGAVLIVTAINTVFHGIGWILYLDPMASFVVIGFMIYNIVVMLSSSMASLLDQAIDEAGQMRILKVLTAHFDDFDELGDIRTRQFGGKMFVELHLAFADDWTVARARRAAAEVSAAVRQSFKEAGDEVDVAIVLMPQRADAAA